MVGEQLSTLQILQLYIGNGALMLLFVVALIYLWSVEKKKGIKFLFVYFSIGLLVIFLFPPLLLFVQNVLGEGETYYRLLWVLPIGIVIPYATVKFFLSCRQKWIGYAVVGLVCIYVAVGGNLVYNAPQLTRAQNWYQLPQEVIDICDEIVVPGREVKAAFPHELVQYVRQYSPYVVMPYGYDALVERWGRTDSFEQEMRKEVSDAKMLAEFARERNTHYIIINRNHHMQGTLKENGFELFTQTANYNVYLDENADLSVK